jgi:E3 ubiquitin-protein ligase TRIP12
VQTVEQKAEKLEDIKINEARLIDLCLDFTLPGYDIDLKEGGSDCVVSMSNVEEYIELGSFLLSYASCLSN